MYSRSLRAVQAKLALDQVNGQTLMSGAADNGWEDRTRCIIPGKARLDHSRSIVTHEGRHFSVISHLILQSFGISITITKRQGEGIADDLREDVQTFGLSYTFCRVVQVKGQQMRWQTTGQFT